MTASPTVTSHIFASYRRRHDARTSWDKEVTWEPDLTDPT